MPDDSFLIPLPDANREALADPRVKGFLDKISKSEGADYNTLVGGRKINDLSKHPNVVGLRTSAGPSTAFGRYQITGSTNRSKLAKYKDLDYSPENQDLRAVELLRQTKALDAIQQGDEPTAIRRAGREWASIPGSPLPGRKNTRAFQQTQKDSFLVPIEQPKPNDSFLVPLEAKTELSTVTPSVTDALKKIGADVTRKTRGLERQARRPLIDSRADLEKPLYEAQRGQPSRVNQTADELRVVKGEQPGNRQAYQQQQDVYSRLGPQPTEIYAPEQPLIRPLTRGERLRQSVSELANKLPGIASLDTQEGISTDFPRGLVSGATLGAIGNEPGSEEQILPGMTRHGLGETVGGLAPLLATGAALPEALSPAMRTVATFGLTGAGKQAVNAAEGRPVDVTAPLEEAALGLVMGKLEGVDPSMKRRIVAYVMPGIGLDLAKGSTPEQAVQRAATNLAFAITSGGKEDAQRDTRAVEQESTQPPTRGAREGIPESAGGLAETPPERGQIDARETEAQRQNEVGRRDSESNVGVGNVRPEPQLSNVGDVGQAARANPRESPVPVAESQRYYHKDWGEVTKLEDQSGARRGRTKVAEVDNPEAIHYPKTADLSGSGNQRMVPIREPQTSTASPEVREGIATHRETPELINAVPNGTQMLLKFTRKEGEVSDTDLKALFPEYHVTVVRKYNALTPEYQGVELTFWNKEGTRQVKAPTDAVQRFGLAKTFYYGQEPELAKTSSQGKLAEPESKGEPLNALPVESAQPASPTDTSVRDVGDSVPPSTTAAKAASMSADRAELDLPELPPAERRGWHEALDKAKERGTQNASILADEAMASGRILNDVETAQLVLRAQEVKNELAKVRRELTDLPDGEAKSAKIAQSEVLQREFNKLSTATKTSGSEKGRTLAAQKLTINQDYDLTSMVQRMVEAKGRDLNPKEHEKVAELSARLEKAQADLEVANERLAQRDLQRQIDKVGRQRRRTETKSSLDDEFADLKTQFAQVRAEIPRVQAAGLAGLDPEGKLTVLIGKMARNRVKAGTVQAEALVDEVYSAIREYVEGVTKRDVRDAISGYGLESKGDRRSEDARRLASLRGELKKLSESEDIEAGRRLSRQDKTRQAQLLRQEAELKRRIAEQDFSPKAKRPPVEYNRETRALETQIAKVKSEYERDLERHKGLFWSNLSGMRKAWLLSGIKTQARNIGGTAAYQVFDEIARMPAAIADAAMSTVTKQRGVSGPSPSAMLDSVLHAVKVGGREAKEIMQLGATKQQMERQQLKEINSGSKVIDTVHNVVFRFMSASDRVFYQQAVRRNLLDRALAQARTEKASNVRERARELADNPTKELSEAADHDALVATFNNSNSLSDAIKRGRSALGPKANFAIDLVLPFDRTPTNVVARVLEASPVGYGKNVVQLAKSAINRSMSAEDQRQFSQTFGRATAGTALLGLGWYLAPKGIITSDDYGNAFLNIAEKKINLTTISPVGNLISIGANLWRAAHKDKGKGRAIAGAVVKPLTDLPLLRSTSDVGETIKDPERSLPRTGGRLASSFIPFSGALRDVATGIDPEEKRYPKTFSDQVKSGLPKLRESLPVSNSPLFRDKTASTPAIVEVRRLGMRLIGTQISPKETAAEYEKRRQEVTPKLMQAIENLIQSDVYKGLSDTRKQIEIKKTIQAVNDNYREEEKTGRPSRPSRSERSTRRERGATL